MHLFKFQTVHETGRDEPKRGLSESLDSITKVLSKCKCHLRIYRHEISSFNTGCRTVDSLVCAPEIK
jgi:hypothetical protein